MAQVQPDTPEQRSSVSRLQSVLRSSEDRLTHTAELLKSAQQENVRLTEKLRSTEAQLASERTKVRGIEVTLQQAHLELATLRATSQLQQGGISQPVAEAIQASVDSVSRMNDRKHQELREQLATAEREKQTQAVTISHLEGEVARLRQHLQHHDTTHHSEIADRDKKQRELEKVTTERDRALSDLRSATTQLSELQEAWGGELATERQRHVHLAQTVDAITKERDALMEQTKLVDLNVYKKAVAERDTFAHRLAVQEAEAENTRATWSGQDNYWSQQIQTLAQEAEKRQLLLEKAAEDRKALTALVQQLSNELRMRGGSPGRYVGGSNPATPAGLILAPPSPAAVSPHSQVRMDFAPVVVTGLAGRAADAFGAREFPPPPLYNRFF